MTAKDKLVEHNCKLAELRRLAAHRDATRRSQLGLR
jgi:hypothetical protein